MALPPPDSLTDADLFPAEVAAQLRQSDAQIVAGAATCSDQIDCWVDGKLLQCLWFKFPVHGTDGRLLFIGAAMLDTARMGNIDTMQRSLELLQNTNHELQTTLVELSKLASTDKLTGAWNRRRLEEALVNEMDRLKRYDHPLSMLIADIDFFKNVNDEHGHNAGDQVLVTLAKVLQSSLRASDTLTRWGGEEFALLLPDSGYRSAERVAEILTEGRVARVTSRAGTDVTLPIEGIAGIASRGLILERGQFGNLPSGEAYLMPEEGKAQGVVVVDGAMAGLGVIEAAAQNNAWVISDVVLNQDLAPKNMLAAHTQNYPGMVEYFYKQVMDDTCAFSL